MNNSYDYLALIPTGYITRIKMGEHHNLRIFEMDPPWPYCWDPSAMRVIAKERGVHIECEQRKVHRTGVDSSVSDHRTRSKLGAEIYLQNSKGFRSLTSTLVHDVIGLPPFEKHIKIPTDQFNVPYYLLTCRRENREAKHPSSKQTYTAHHFHLEIPFKTRLMDFWYADRFLTLKETYLIPKDLRPYLVFRKYHRRDIFLWDLGGQSNTPIKR